MEDHDKPTLMDNRELGSVGDFLKQEITPDCKLAIVSAYFTIFAYKALKEQLDDIESLRFLFGEPRFVSNISQGQPDKRQYQIEDEQLVVSILEKLKQHQLARQCHDWLKAKAEIKSMVKPNFLHGKLYHILPQNKAIKAVLGSSNFTVNGLGLGKSPNIELNIQATDDRDKKALLRWFDKIWNDKSGIIEDVKEEVLKYIQQLYAHNSPQFIYYKTIYHIFAERLADKESEPSYPGTHNLQESQIYQKLYPFQKDGVIAMLSKLKEFGGCILADSVGLGKTYEALAVIKEYESRNKEVLVLCPKKLKDNWALYQAKKHNRHNPFPLDRFGYSLMYHTDLGRQSGYSDADGVELAHYNWSKFDLVVIDESHNLKGNPKTRETQDGIQLNRVKFLLDKVIKEGAKTRVLMLSATPVNNSLKDLRNQIYFITEEKDDALEPKTGITSIEQTLAVAQRQFTEWSKHRKKTSSSLLNMLDPTFIKLLTELTIARSRKHILKFYTAADIGTFPLRLKPISVFPTLDTQNSFYSYEQISDEIEKYKLSIFNPQMYLYDEYKELYKYVQDIQKPMIEAFTQADRELRLIGMIKVGILKRLESSIKSFELTLQRTAQRIEELLATIDAYQNRQNTETELELQSIFDEEQQAEMEEFDNAAFVGKKLKYSLEHLDLQRWKKDLATDRDQLSRLREQASLICKDRDAKLQDLKSRIKHKLQNPINPDNPKVLIFTAFADTAHYLYQELSPWAKQTLGLHSALVTGGGKNKSTLKPKLDFNSILSCFAPLAHHRDQDDLLKKLPQIDILIGTDCISEGQNLQDCDLVINYDIHWNPVRVIQRFGRIDRLNSPNTQIQLLNYWPTKELDEYINLKQRVEARMTLVDSTATGMENPLGDHFDEDIAADHSFRNAQLKKMKDENLDLEDVQEGLSASDLNLDGFMADLLSHFKADQNTLRDAPLGLFALAPSPHHQLWEGSELSEDQKNLIQPGLIFCFRIMSDDQALKKNNSTHPYFLVYIYQSGSVRYQFTHAKQILELYRTLALGRDKAYEPLCSLFDTQTHDGKDMSVYNILLKESLESMRSTLSHKEDKAITQDRDALWGKGQDKQIENFELISWLIIK